MTDRRYRIFASVSAFLAAMVAFGIAVAYKLRPDLTRNASAAFACLILALLIVAYYLSFHQILKRKLAAASTIIVALLSAADIWLVIGQTGGLDSPYLALWLGYIGALGVLGRIWPIIAAIGTIAGYIASMILNHQHSLSSTRLIQLGFVIIAAGLAQVVAARAAKDNGQPAGGSNLTGQLNQEQLKTQALMASMGEGVVVVNGQRQVQLFNRAAQLLTGWDDKAAQSLDYRTVLKLKTAQDKDVTDNVDPFLKAWNAGTSVSTNDLIITTQAGRRFTITMTTSPIFSDDGKITGGIGLFRDISAEKVIERQRNEFISTASHEMRTPIAAIEGYLALAINPTTATIDDRAKGYLDKAHDSIGHLGELFKNLLVITKLEDKQLADKIEVINMSQLVQKAVEDMQTVAQKKGLTLQLASGTQLVAETNPVMPIYRAKGNPERLREVVMNLIENAIKYTPAGRVSVNITGDDDSLTVGVTDTGLGIASEDLPYLFQKFYRVDSSATRTIGGTGLGLYICRTVIELYGGQVWAESKVGTGSTFSFKLPRIKNEATANVNSAIGAAPTAGIITTTATTAAPTVPVDVVKAPATIAPASHSLLS